MQTALRRFRVANPVAALPPTPPSGFLNSYFTSFGLTEDPISEGLIWTNGFDAGVDWTNVQTSPGLAFTSAQGAGTTDPNDATAILTGRGSWSNHVRLTSTLKHTPVDLTHFRECEFRFNTIITPHVNRGYEVNFGIGNGRYYIQVVRWNGPHGGLGVGFDFVTSGLTLGGVTFGDGDVCSCTKNGNLVLVFVNGAQVGSTVDVSSIGGTVWTDGFPGIGFYNEVTSAYGWKDFRAEEI